MQNYDIFCVNETKIDKYDTIHLDGYTFISQCRRQNFFRKSGGIGVFVKNYLSPYVSLVESDSDYILWVKLNKKFTQIDQDIIFGAVYLPPSDSRFNTPDELENFEIEITNMCVSQKYVILMGDFNSRTGNKQDFLDADNFLADLFHFDDAMQQFFDISSILEQYKFSKNRKSKDSVVNNEGNRLLDICKSNNLIILNGRCGQDKETGAYTFKSISVIDYTIASTEVLKYIDCFAVRTLDPIFSDGHALLSTTLQFKSKQYEIPKANKHPKGSQRPKWSENKSAQFSRNISNEQVNDIKMYIENARHDMVNVNKETMNNICGKIADTFTQAAGKSFGDQNDVKDITDSKDSKRWFGYNCRSARRKYHIASCV